MQALLTLNALPKVGPIRIRRLIQQFGSPEAVLKQSTTALLSVHGVGPEIAEIIRSHGSIFDPDKELAACEQLGITLLTPESELWPRGLDEVDGGPVLLYVKGELSPADRHAVGIVGSRRCSHYGREVTRLFGSRLARSGYTILSGLALGIDTIAHEAALETGGRTIAILGSGLTRLYPRENKPLAQAIADGQGAVISEFPLGSPPDKQSFPQRNRIVASWSKALVVTECSRRSGSLITAGYANDAGRSVFAVPGPIDRPSSEGCHDLIRDGAILAYHPDQVADDLRSLPMHSRARAEPAKQQELLPLPTLTPEEELVFSHLDTRERSIDELTAAAGLPVYQVSTILLGLEMKGAARQIAGQRYVRNGIIGHS
ncbi:MAG: DNA-processing protein DprA [Verrucomicrobiota bacterium JB023]|nr:DNA-processing protein DprA [Verrucomicrobiota bacterium JB023]